MSIYSLEQIWAVPVNRIITILKQRGHTPRNPQHDYAVTASLYHKAKRIIDHDVILVAHPKFVDLMSTTDNLAAGVDLVKRDIFNKYMIMYMSVIRYIDCEGRHIMDTWLGKLGSAPKRTDIRCALALQLIGSVIPNDEANYNVHERLDIFNNGYMPPHSNVNITRAILNDTVNLIDNYFDHVAQWVLHRDFVAVIAYNMPRAKMCPIDNIIRDLMSGCLPADISRVPVPEDLSANMGRVINGEVVRYVLGHHDSIITAMYDISVDAKSFDMPTMLLRLMSADIEKAAPIIQCYHLFIISQLLALCSNPTLETRFKADVTRYGFDAIFIPVSVLLPKDCIDLPLVLIDIVSTYNSRLPTHKEIVERMKQLQI